MANHHDPAFGNLDSIAAPRTWAQRIVEQQRAQNFEGGCRLGSLAAEWWSQLTRSPTRCSLLRRAGIYSRRRIETHTLSKPRSVPRSTTSNRLRSRPASALPDIWVQWGALAVSS
jgi:hypothetical protein